MKKYLAGIAALALVIGIVVTGCQFLPDDEPEVSVTKFTQGDYDYVLEFRDNGTYVLTGTHITTGEKIISAGTYSETNGTKTLIPSGETAGGQITVSAPGADGKVTVEIAGDIPFEDKDGNTVEKPLDAGTVEAEDETPVQSGSGVSETNAQVYYEDSPAYSGSAKVYIEVYNEITRESVYLEAGSITGGKLTLKLPASVEDKYLMDSSALNGEDGVQITVTPATVKIGNGSLYVSYGDEYRDLYYEKETEDGYSDIMYMYFSEAAKATGSYSDSYSEDGYSVTINVNININGTKGWNKIYSSGTKTNTGYTQTVTSDLSKASGLKWYVDIYSGEDKESDQGGQNDQGGSVVVETNAQVYNRDDSAYSGSAPVYIEVYNEITKESAYLPAGDITGGKLTFSLPASINDKYLMDSATVSEISGVQITVTPASVKIGSGSLYVYYDGDYKYLSYTKETKDEWSEIQYLYLSEAAKVTGSHSDDYFTSIVNINGTRGWNRIYASGKETSTGYTATATSDLSNVSGLKWYVDIFSSEYEDGGSDARPEENGEAGGSATQTGETAANSSVRSKKVFSR